MAIDRKSGRGKSTTPTRRKIASREKRMLGMRKWLEPERSTDWWSDCQAKNEHTHSSRKKRIAIIFCFIFSKR
jgi:hypothetical protein